MTDLFIQTLHNWQNFYVLVGTASATLTGLTFIAASLGTGLIPADSSQEVHTWVTPMISHFSAVLFTCILLSVPTLTSVSAGIVLGVGGLWGLRYIGQIAGRLRQQAKKSTKIPISDAVWHVVLPAVAYLLIICTAAGLLMNIDLILSVLGLALATLLAASVRNTWDLVVWIAQKHP